MNFFRLMAAVTVIALFHICLPGTVSACSVELSIALVFEEGDKGFSEVITDIDKLLRTVAIPISQGETVEISDDYGPSLEPLFNKLLTQYSENHAPEFIYDENLWKEYHAQVKALVEEISGHIKARRNMPFHDAVQKLEEVLLTIYRNRGKKDYRVVYPLIAGYRDDPAKLTVEDMDLILKKVRRSISIMQPNTADEKQMKGLMEQMEKLLVELRQKVAEGGKGMVSYFEGFISDIMRLENAILNMRWFAKKGE